MVMLASGLRAAMPISKPLVARAATAPRAAVAPKLGMTRPVLVGQPLVSVWNWVLCRCQI
jgi:hypothetical protein